MTRRQTILGVTVLFLACLAIGVIWTLRTEPPSANPWWAGKNATVRIEVWKPGHDMATFGMTLPKKNVDTMVALGMKAKIEVGDYDLDLRRHWKEVQAIPPGERYVLREGEATIYVWIETPDVKLPPITPAPADTIAGT